MVQCNKIKIILLDNQAIYLGEANHFYSNVTCNYKPSFYLGCWGLMSYPRVTVGSYVILGVWRYYNLNNLESSLLGGCHTPKKKSFNVPTKHDNVSQWLPCLNLWGGCSFLEVNTKTTMRRSSYHSSWTSLSFTLSIRSFQASQLSPFFTSTFHPSIKPQLHFRHHINHSTPTVTIQTNLSEKTWYRYILPTRFKIT